MGIKKFIVGAVLLLCVSVAQAQSKGDLIISAGGAYFIPQGGSDSLGRKAALEGFKGMPIEHNPLSDKGIESVNSPMFNLSATYFITDHLAGEFVFNLPERIYLRGTRELDGEGRVGSVQHESFAFLLKYYFSNAEQRLRPYLGVGISRTLFSSAEVDTKAILGEQIGSIFSIRNQWEPVFNAGLIYRLSQSWFIDLSVSYMPLETTARLRIPLDDSMPFRTEPSIKMDSIVPNLRIGLRF